MARKKVKELTPELLELRAACEADLVTFIEYIHPKRLLGDIHREISSWCNRSGAKRRQIILLPRDHMKSTLIGGYRVAQRLTKEPWLKFLYISSTSNLAVKQLKFIKDILTCDAYRLLWPEMVHEDETKREKWTEREISIDHPKRKEENIRDPSIFTAGLTSNIVGMHCDITVLDDVVVAQNAYTAEGREKVKEQYGYLSSIGGTDAEEWVVGTRYHPNDLYADLIERQVEQYNDLGEITGTSPLFEVFGGEDHRKQRVETNGEFLWPRQKRTDGRWFGFDVRILADKRSSYSNHTQFRAQYYNDPHDVESSPFQRDVFQYYDRGYIFEKDGRWFHKGQRLNVFAAVDFAFSLEKAADYTALVCIGVDSYNNYYILDIDRFKTNKISDYYARILKLHSKWGFHKLRAEVSAAQIAVVNDLKENYIKRYGLALSIDEYRPSRVQGNKEERIFTILEPKYSNKQMWHYKGGYCQLLEEELLFANPQHDDIKDALAAVVDLAVSPKNYMNMYKPKQTFQYNTRFGGVA